MMRAVVGVLGGRIEAVAEAGRGARIRLPLATGLTRIVLPRSGPLAVGVPASLVDGVRSAGPQALRQAQASSRFGCGGELAPFYCSGEMPSSARYGLGPPQRDASVVLLRGAARRALPCMWTKCWAVRKW